MKKTTAVALTILLVIYQIAMFTFFGVTVLSAPAANVGPSNNGITTQGVFRPGGYLQVNITTGKSAIQGYYEGTVRVNSILSSEQIQKGIAGPSLDSDVGGAPFGVGGILGSVPADQLSLPVTVSILTYFPNNRLLSGQTITLSVGATYTYPVATGQYSNSGAAIYQDSTSDFAGTIDVSIHGPSLSSWETYAMGQDLSGQGLIQNPNPENLLLLVFWVADIFAIIGVWIRYLKGKELKAKTNRQLARLAAEKRLLCYSENWQGDH